MKSGYAILELNFKTGSEFRTVLYGKNFQVFSRKTLFEKRKTWWFVSIHLCICAHVEVPLSSSLVEVWWAENYVNIVIITKMTAFLSKWPLFFKMSANCKLFRSAMSPSGPTWLFVLTNWPMYEPIFYDQIIMNRLNIIGHFCSIRPLKGHFGINNGHFW